MNVNFKWRKWIAVATLAAVLLSGCQKKEEYGLDPAQPVSVTVWHYYNGAQKNAFDALVDEFNQTVGLEKGIVVEGHNQGSVTSLEESVIASMNREVGSPNMPNIFQSYADMAFAAEQKGLLADLDPYFPKEEQDDYIQAYLEEGRIGKNGELKIFPVAKSTEVMMINKTVWDEFVLATGASTEELQTKEGVVRTAKKYYEWTDAQTPDVPDDGKAFYGRDAVANLFIIGSKQLGCELFQVQNGEVTLNIDKDIMKRIWDVYYVPTLYGYFGAYGRFRSDDAKVGKVIALTGSTSSAAYFPTEVTEESGKTYPIQAMVLPNPIFEGGEKVSVQQGAGMAVVKSTPAQEYASVLFLEWLTQSERNLQFSYESGYLPVRRDANNYDLVAQVANEALSPVRADTLRVSFDIIQNHSLYTNKAFAHGGEARQILENHLADKAQEDLLAIDSLVKQGNSRDAAAAQFDTAENFENWYADFRTALENVVSEK